MQTKMLNTTFRIKHINIMLIGMSMDAEYTILWVDKSINMGNWFSTETSVNIEPKLINASEEAGREVFQHSH
jgi:hypothetical protein